jgi:drug/metabolite transporter (DMT)-like permease
MGMFRAGRSAVFYGIGAVLVVAGIVCLAFYGSETPGRNDTAQYVAWNVGFTVGAAILLGVGLLLLATGFVRGRRRRAERSRRGASSPDLEPGATSEVRR